MLHLFEGGMKWTCVMDLTAKDSSEDDEELQWGLTLFETQCNDQSLY